MRLAHYFSCFYAYAGSVDHTPNTGPDPDWCTHPFLQRDSFGCGSPDVRLQLSHFSNYLDLFRTEMWRTAEVFGAVCHTSLDSDITHIVTAKVCFYFL